MPYRALSTLPALPALLTLKQSMHSPRRRGGLQQCVPATEDGNQEIRKSATIKHEVLDSGVGPPLRQRTVRQCASISGVLILQALKETLGTSAYADR